MTYPLGVWQALLVSVYVADKVRLGEYDFVPTGRLAEDLAIPAPSVARLLGSLSRAGIVETREGARGGVRLAVPPKQVNLLAIVEAVDPGRLFRTDAAPAVTGPTPTRRQRALRDALGRAEDAMRSALEEVTLATVSET